MNLNSKTTEELASPERRQFFRRFAAAKTESIIPVSQHPRPPWAVENDLFIALCTQCDQCIDACPQRVLGRSEEADAALKGKPILDLAYGSCDFCGECVDACTSNALNRDTGKQRQVLPKLISSCQESLGMYCKMCADACAANAISFDNSKIPLIDTKLCTGCGECALDCQTKVLEMARA